MMPSVSGTVMRAMSNSPVFDLWEKSRELTWRVLLTPCQVEFNYLLFALFSFLSPMPCDWVERAQSNRYENKQFFSCLKQMSTPSVSMVRLNWWKYVLVVMFTQKSWKTDRIWAHSRVLILDIFIHPCNQSRLTERKLSNVSPPSNHLQRFLFHSPPPECSICPPFSLCTPCTRLN